MRETLLELMKGDSKPRIGFCSPLWIRGDNITLGWSDYWRLAIPAVALARNGWDVVLVRGLAGTPDGRLMVKDQDGNWHSDREIIVFHRWITSSSAELIARARNAGQVIINDLDDHFWAFPPDHPGVELLDPKRDSEYNLDNYRATLRTSSAITVSTPLLAEAVAAWGPQIHVIRNRIDLGPWGPIDKRPGSYHGWIGSTAGRTEDLEILRENVVPWLKDRNLPFYHGGYRPGEPKMKDILAYDKVVVRQAQYVTRYPRLWEPLKVALCPLGDTTFANAKSWVKPLEACAREIPFIASSQKEYVELGAGRLVTSEISWSDHLEALENAETYAAEVQANRNAAHSHSIENHWKEWADLLEEKNVPRICI